MAARTSIIDESADDGVPADFWNEVLDSFDVMDDDEGSEEAQKAQAERARKKKEDEEEKVKRFNEAWNIAPAEEEPRRIVMSKPAEPEPEPMQAEPVEAPEPVARTASPDDCTIIQEETVVITIEEEAVKVSENSVVVIPAEGQPKDPRLKRLEETSRIASPSSPTQESRSTFTEDPPQRYFQMDRNREREREEQLRKEREEFERARNLLRSRSPGTYLRRSMSDEEEDIGRRIPRRRDRSRSRRRSRSRDRSSRSPRRNRRSRSRSHHGRSRSRRLSKSRSRSRSRSRRAEASSSSRNGATAGGAVSPSTMFAQMQAMMQMMSDPTKIMQMNPMMAMMMNPMAMAMAANSGRGGTQVVTEEAAEKMDKKDELTAQLFLENKINLSDYLSSSNSKKKAVRSNDRVSQRIKEAISILDKHETKVQSARFLYVAPTYHKDLKKLDNRSPLIWNEENVLYASTSKSKDVGLCEPFRNVNHKMKQMIERLGLDEGNISQRIAKKKKEEASNRAGADVGTIQAITIVPVRGGAASRRIIDRSVQTDELTCLECVQRRNKTFISVNTQTASRSRMVEISVQTDRDRDVELNSMNELNANQVKILNEIMKYMKKRQVSGNMTNLLHSLERDAPELRNQHLSAGLHYVTEINERNERNANRYANPNPLNPAVRDMASFRTRDPRGQRDRGAEDSSSSISMVPAGFRASPPRRTSNNNNAYNRNRPW